jgi:hypothetical protein
VFYVGKGIRDRAWQHEAEVRKGRTKHNARKCAVIQDIIGAGLSVRVRIVAKYEVEQDAFDHEEELIAVLPGLTNILARGGGWALTPEEAARRQEERQKRLAAQKRIKTRQWLRDWLAKVDEWGCGVTFPGIPDGDRKAEEFVSMVRQSLAISDPVVG